MTLTKHNPSETMGTYNEPQTISWTCERQFIVCYHTCPCGTTTPLPTSSELVDFARDYPTTHFMWPFDHGWFPSGWCKVLDQWACPACVAKATATLGWKT